MANFRFDARGRAPLVAMNGRIRPTMRREQCNLVAVIQVCQLKFGFGFLT